MIALSGPMFEPAIQDVWKSAFNKEGAHYNIFGCNDYMGMEGLRLMFPEGEANALNFVLFSTSGIHGTYVTIEDAEEMEEGSVTFLIIQPRICCLRYGNCEPETKEDFEFLRSLRASSWRVVQEIGREE